MRLIAVLVSLCMLCCLSFASDILEQYKNVTWEDWKDPSSDKLIANLSSYGPIVYKSGYSDTGFAFISLKNVSGSKLYYVVEVISSAGSVIRRWSNFSVDTRSVVVWNCGEIAKIGRIGGIKIAHSLEPIREKVAGNDTKIGRGDAGKKLSFPGKQDVYTGPTLPDGSPHGKGSMIYRDGKKYIGFFENGRREGFGILYGPNGEMLFEGVWHLNEPVRK